MSDLFRNAFNYIGTNVSNGDNEFVGQEICVNEYKLRIKKVIAEGGFAFVFVAQNTSNGEHFALKRLLATDRGTSLGIQQEISISKLLSNHPNIMTFISSSMNETPSKHPGKTEFLLLTELCRGGSLVDALGMLDGNTLSVEEVCTIMYQLARAVQHMHNQSPAIIHRDLKIENLLFGEDGLLKLCDFGSAISKEYIIDANWSATQRGLLEEKMAAYTTPMYRAPEMLDTWNNYPITKQADVWAMGCILYLLCYLKHPFEDSAKLRILNGNFAIPANDGKFECLHQLIKGMLTVDPSKRFKIAEVLERLAAIGEVKNFKLRGPIKIKQKTIEVSTPVQQTPNGAPSRPAMPEPSRSAPQRPAPPTPSMSTQAMQPAGSGLFSSIKGYSGSIFKNLKDTSNKVMQTVSQSITRTELDFSYITSRVIAMSYPADGFESAYRNHVEDVKAVLEARHPGHHVVYNVSGRQYHSPKFNAKIFEGNWSATKPPTLGALYNFSSSVLDYLAKDPKNVVVVHCMDGKASTAVLVSSLLLLSRTFDRPERALNMFAVKRTPPGLQPSQFRYLVYMHHLSSLPAYVPHFKPLTLTSLCFSPLPLFTQKRDGIRPYVEVWQGDHRILSTLQDFDSAKLYLQAEREVSIALSVHVVGDVCIYVYHARKLMGKVHGIKVAQVQFQTGFIPEHETSLFFALNQLDDVTEPDRYPAKFEMVLNFVVSNSERKPPKQPPWLARPATTFKPDVLFSTAIEKEECIDKYGSAHSSPQVERKVQPTPDETQNFMSSLQWQPPSNPPLNESEAKPASESAEAMPKRVPPPRPPPATKAVTTEMDFLSLNEDKSAPVEDTELLLDPPIAPPLAPPTDVNNYDLLSGFEPSAPKSEPQQSNLFDPFGIETEKDAADLLGQFAFPSHTPDANVIPNMMNNMRGSSNIIPDITHSNTSTASRCHTPQDRNNDPFADLGFGGWGGSKSTTPTGGNTPLLSSPIHQATPAMRSNAPFRPPPPNAPKTPTGTPHHQMKSPTANYGRTNFENLNAGGKNAKSGDCFDDLLGSQGFTFATKDTGPKTMGQMKKQEITKTMDPEKLKIYEWTAGGTNNIRALLCSMHTILWDGAKWNECAMSQLVHHNDVKKMYRRACLAVHPDKLAGSEHEPLAKLLFMELNEAYTEFDNDPSQQVFKK